MFNETIEDKFIIDTAGTSEGTQTKFFYNNYWYKTDAYGEEGLAEYLSSKLLSFSDLSEKEYVSYECGFLNGKRACRSKNFLSFDEEFITFERLHQSTVGGRLYDIITAFDTIPERVAYTVNFIKAACRIDATDYLRKTFTLDYIILNEDRHFHNLGLIRSSDSKFRPAPIFDNGKSLLTGNVSILKNAPISENIKRVTAEPFSGSHKATYDYFGKGFSVDFKSAISEFEKEPDSFPKDVLLYRLKELSE